MDEKPKKSLRTLGQHQPASDPRPSIVGGIKNAAMAQSEATRQAPLPGPHLPHQGFAPFAPPKPQTYSLRVERIRQLSDEQLMQYLTRESVPSDGVMDEGAKMAITMELMRRQSEKASQPHRPTFWLLVVSLVLTFLWGVGCCEGCAQLESTATASCSNRASSTRRLENTARPFIETAATSSTTNQRGISIEACGM